MFQFLSDQSQPTFAQNISSVAQRMLSSARQDHVMFDLRGSFFSQLLTSFSTSRDALFNVACDGKERRVGGEEGGGGVLVKKRISSKGGMYVAVEHGS